MTSNRIWHVSFSLKGKNEIVIKIFNVQIYVCMEKRRKIHFHFMLKNRTLNKIRNLIRAIIFTFPEWWHAKLKRLFEFLYFCFEKSRAFETNCCLNETNFPFERRRNNKTLTTLTQIPFVLSCQFVFFLSWYWNNDFILKGKSCRKILFVIFFLEV